MSMIETGYVEAPNDYTGTALTVFLAGGITGCPDWQQGAASRLVNDAVVLNPRRADFPINDATAAPHQIGWEYRHLRRADLLLFWFPAGAIQPIALLELGAYAYAGLGAKQIVVGADPAYVRRPDVVHQLGQARPDLPVHDNLGAVIDAVKLAVATMREATA